MSLTSWSSASPWAQNKGSQELWTSESLSTNWSFFPWMIYVSYFITVTQNQTQPASIPQLKDTHSRSSKRICEGAGEMDRQLRMLAVLPEDNSLVPCIHGLQLHETPTLGDLMSFLGTHMNAHINYACRYIHIHVNKNILKCICKYHGTCLQSHLF